MPAFFVLLLLFGIIAGIVLLYRDRRISGKVVVVGCVLAGLFLFFAVLPEHAQRSLAAVVVYLFIAMVIFWLARALLRLVRRVFRGTWLGTDVKNIAAPGRRFFEAAFANHTPPDCPPIARLQDLLADRLSSAEQARVAAHLEGCKACQYRLEGLTAGQKSWPGMAQKVSERPPAPEPALQRVIDQLKWGPAERTRDEPVFSAELPLGFLSPPEKPEHLGRLERYEVLSEIGRGGMGVVLKAFDPTLHRVVAIKVLAPQLATSGVARKRFLREAKAAAAVTHDHIVTIHAVDEANGIPYLVMQYIPGVSLQERIDKDGPLDLAEVLRIGMQTASGLAAAHAHGIVHRDIKPGNILLEEGLGRVKITDFGLARAMDDASLTQSGFVAGSPLYMAPEQARGEALDHRADLFSLGSVLYTMCTGRPPFRAVNTLAVLRRVSEQTPRPIRETNPEVPDWLVAVVDRLMAKDPADRFGSAAEVVDVLGKHLPQLHHGAAVPPPPPVPGHSTTDLPTSVTLCPSCGASLNVPEKMVGEVVHCAVCGKPFHVEDGSEVIQVARPLQTPVGRQLCRRRRIRPWFVLPVGCALLLLLLFFALSVIIYASRGTSVTRPARGPGMKDTRATRVATTAAGKLPEPVVDRVIRPEPRVGDRFWQNTLDWFPAEASLFGAVDLKSFGSLSLDDDLPQSLLRLAAPRKTADKLTVENLGRIRLDTLSLGYYEEPRPEKSRLLVQVEGLALDGRKRIIDFIRRETADRAGVEPFDGLSSNPVRISSPELPFALGLAGDDRLFLASAGGRDNGTGKHLDALKMLHRFDFSGSPRPQTKNLLYGYQPPWVRAALEEVPADPFALVVGEIPAVVRKELTDSLGLRACPRSLVLHLKRSGDNIVLSLTLNVEKKGAELLLQEDLEQWRRTATNALQDRFLALRKEPEAVALVGQALKTARWGANPGGCVRIHLELPGPTFKALGTLLKRLSLAADK
jgi:serine/threonine-protein kinase